jgi:glutathione S-transferase
MESGSEGTARAAGQKAVERIVLFRCPVPTDHLCPCGRAARSLRKAGVEFETRRVPARKSRRPEVVELTGQKRVPVLVHGNEVIHDSKRIVEYVEREFAAR